MIKKKTKKKLKKVESKKAAPRKPEVKKVYNPGLNKVVEVTN